MDGHVRCMVGIAVWGRMYGNREFRGEPGSLLLYIIGPPCCVEVLIGFSFEELEEARCQ